MVYGNGNRRYNSEKRYTSLAAEPPQLDRINELSPAVSLEIVGHRSG